MNIVAPTWHLNKVCPRCSQGDSLSYQKCSICGRFVLGCDEENIEFEGLDQNDLIYARDYAGSCNQCGNPGSLRDVTSEEMLELGLTKDDYH